YVDPRDGRAYAFNPEFGVFGVAKDTNESSNPNAIESIAPETKTLFTNVAYNENTHEVWWEGRTPAYPADLTGWIDWRGERVTDRRPGRRRSSAAGTEWPPRNSRSPTPLANVQTLARGAYTPAGVPIDAIIFGGRVREREPLIRAIRGLPEGVYDGLTL